MERDRGRGACQNNDRSRKRGVQWTMVLKIGSGSSISGSEVRVCGSYLLVRKFEWLFKNISYIIL
jgi:hypothetical protein